MNDLLFVEKAKPLKRLLRTRMLAAAALAVCLLLAACAEQPTPTPAATTAAPATTTPEPELVATVAAATATTGMAVVETATSPAAPPAEATATTAAPAATATNAAGRGNWQEAAPMLTARSEMPAVVINGLIYVPGGLGGENRLEVYDPAADSWQALANLPERRHHLMAAAYEGRLYLFGGATPNWEPTHTAWVYDPAADSWSEVAAMPEARLSGAAVALDDALYVVGGIGGTTALLRYDPAADSWSALPRLSEPREHLAAVALDGKIYALGGRWEGVGESATVEVYDPATGDGWTAAPNMNERRSGFGAAVLNGQIVALGGEIIFTGRATLDSVEWFDPAAGRWTYGTAMPYVLHGVPAATVGDALYVIGGSDVAASAINSGRLLVYRP